MKITDFNFNFCYFPCIMAGSENLRVHAHLERKQRKDVAFIQDYSVSYFTESGNISLNKVFRQERIHSGSVR